MHHMLSSAWHISVAIIPFNIMNILLLFTTPAMTIIAISTIIIMMTAIVVALYYQYYSYQYSYCHFIIVSARIVNQYYHKFVIRTSDGMPLF